MEKDKKFPLSHTTLYCKGWYDISENPFDDLRKTLTADGYSGEYFTDKNIVEFLLGKIDEYFELFKKAYNPLGFRDLYVEIDKFCWLYNDMENRSFEYKVWRWIRYQISQLYKEDFVFAEPDYNILPKIKYYKKPWLHAHLYPIFESQTYAFDFGTIEGFKNIAETCLTNAVDELIEREQFLDILEEYDNDKQNIINLVKEDYINEFCDKHHRLFEEN